MDGAVVLKRLLAMYGSARMMTTYAGQDFSEVRDTWREQLADMPPDALQYGLDHLPVRYPPNVLEFRALCATRPQNPLAAAAAPPPSPEVVQRAVEALKATRAAIKSRSAK